MKEEFDNGEEPHWSPRQTEMARRAARGHHGAAGEAEPGDHVTPEEALESGLELIRVVRLGISLADYKKCAVGFLTWAQ
jgi:hypothetical protein